MNDYLKDYLSEGLNLELVNMKVFEGNNLDEAKGLYCEIIYHAFTSEIYCKLADVYNQEWLYKCYRLNNLSLLYHRLEVFKLRFTDKEREEYDAFTTHYDEWFNDNMVKPYDDLVNMIMNSTSDVDKRFDMYNKYLDEMNINL